MGDALLRCQQKTMKMVEVIKVKQQMEPTTVWAPGAPLTGRSGTPRGSRSAKPPADSDRSKKSNSQFLVGEVPRGNNVRVETRKAGMTIDRRKFIEQQPQDGSDEESEEELFTRESMKIHSTRMAAESERAERLLRNQRRKSVSGG